jgi:hypothetical protein
LENNLNDTQVKMTAMIAQNKLLQDQLLALQGSSMPHPMLAENIVWEVQQRPADVSLINTGGRQGGVNMEEDEPIPICSGGDELKFQAQAHDGNPDCNGDDVSYGT